MLTITFVAAVQGAIHISSFATTATRTEDGWKTGGLSFPSALPKHLNCQTPNALVREHIRLREFWRSATNAAPQFGCARARALCIVGDDDGAEDVH